MTLRLGLKLAQQLPLSRYLNDLVEHHTVRVGDAGKERKQVCCDTVAVDVHLRVRLYHGRQVYFVNVHQRIGTDNPVTCPEIFVRSLEVGHRERSVPELECHETVAVFADFLLVEPPVPDMLFRQNIIRL